MAAVGTVCHFVVRDLKSTANNALSDAFRAHLPPECLDRLNLRIGDVCQLITEDESVTAYAIAWRATDKLGSPKIPPVKLTETLREAFGLKLGAQVSVRKSDGLLQHASRVVLTEVTAKGETAASDDQSWLTRCKYALLAEVGNCEAIVPNVTFEVSSRPRGPKKRFFVEQVVPASLGSRHGLFVCDDRTQVSIQEVPATPTTSGCESFQAQVLHLHTERIGGLVEQLKSLNRRLASLTSAARITNGILIHGYEGTGKTLILNEMQALPFRTVQRLDESTLHSTTSKNTNTINETFATAKSAQPSLVLIDDIDKIFGNDSSYTTALSRGIASIRNTAVLVVAATRQLMKVSSLISGPQGVNDHIELPVPDAVARTQILQTFFEPETVDLGLCNEIGQTSHGYTGRDLAALHAKANINALDRFWITCQEEQIKPDAQSADDSIQNDHSDRRDTISPALTISSSSLRQIRRSDFEVAFKYIRPTALREVVLEPPKIKWSDIGGSSTMKSRFDEIIDWPLNHAATLAEYGGKYQPPKGVLLYGPPGCSKTMTAQAVASTYGLNFLAVKGAELISQYVGESERAVREVFQKAKAAAPCVIFFDEIDSIASTRSQNSSGSSGLNVLTTLLNEMDGFERLHDVYILAATNKPEVLDAALLRPGRFDQHVYVGPPTAPARFEIMRIALQGVPLDEDVDLHALVLPTEGYSGADIVSVCRQALADAIRRRLAASYNSDEGKVTQNDLVEAAERVPSSIMNEMLEAYTAFQRRTKI